MSLGKRLAEARKAHGLSQVALASRCGISDSAQLKFEKDENIPGSAYLLKLAELGIDVNHVLFGLPGAMTPEEGVLLNAFRAADAKTRHAMLSHAPAGQPAAGAAPKAVKAKNIGQVVQGSQRVKGSQTVNVGTRKR